MHPRRRALHHAQDRTFLVEEEGQWEEYRPSGGLPEQPLIDWARQLLAPGEVFVDVGAHCGTWALQLASPTTPVIAYEAQYSTFCKLAGGVALNRLEAHVRAVHAAVDDAEAADVPFHVVGGEGGGSSLLADTVRDVIVRTESVPAVTLDGERALFLPGRIGLIKIDVEGAELRVLRGAQRLIDEDAPHLLVECWDTPERALLFNFVAGVLGYRVTAIAGYPEMWLFAPADPPARPRTPPAEPLPTPPAEPTLLDRAPPAMNLWGGGFQRFDAGHAPATIEHPERYTASIPSVCVHGDELWCAIRWINYANDRAQGWNCRDPEGVIRSVPEILRLDPETLDLRGGYGLDPTPAVAAEHPRHPSISRGFEDLRLVRLPDGWAATATATDHHPHSLSEMFLLRFHDDPAGGNFHLNRVTRLAPPAGTPPGRLQKNWVPIHDAAEESLTYVYGPGTVVYQDGRLAAPDDHAALATTPLFDLRGSSQAIALDPEDGGGWLYVGHHDHPPDVGHLPHTLTHRLVWLDAHKRVQKASRRFSFLAPGVEYCAGLARHGKELLFSFAVWERELWLYRTSLRRVLGTLVPVASLPD